MAFGKKKKVSKSTGDKKWMGIGTIWASDKFDGHYFKVDKRLEGDLVFMSSEGKAYKIKQMSCFEGGEKAPDAVVANLVVDLNNEYHVEEIDDED